MLMLLWNGLPTKTDYSLKWIWGPGYVLSPEMNFVCVYVHEYLLLFCMCMSDVKWSTVHLYAYVSVKWITHLNGLFRWV